MIERDFDVTFIARLALQEKQIQQNYRPTIAIHKWFARRPGTLFRGLLLSEFGSRPLREAYYRAHSFPGLLVVDPFMGGGTPLVEANRLGCDVAGWDINPMAWWIVRQALEHLDLDAYTQAGEGLRAELESRIGRFYRTRCAVCGAPDAQVKYFLWVKTLRCPACGHEIDLFPGQLLAANSRHPRNVFVCPRCGQLIETDERATPGRCPHCGEELGGQGPARNGRVRCPNCGETHVYPVADQGPPTHRLFALEYYCPRCRGTHRGRFFKAPDEGDLALLRRAEAVWQGIESRYVPDDEIPPGDETNRLHRWGYRRYREMFNPRQLMGLELSCRLIAAQADSRVRDALATNLSDLLRYQNMLCRYDPVALKSLDIFSVHGFPVGLVQCESNLLGIRNGGTGTCIGSGGWANVLDKFYAAMVYSRDPFEVRHSRGRKTRVYVRGEWIGDRRDSSSEAERGVRLFCDDAATASLPTEGVDAVITDPPYFGNVQYAELMDFCYVWLRRLVGGDYPAFGKQSTRDPAELTANTQMRRGQADFTEGLSAVFQRMAHALKPGAPLVFTYHHNKMEAYLPVAVAVLDAGLLCTASISCPAEMGGSIHIAGTSSSVVDTVFVCRRTSGTETAIPATREHIVGKAAEDVSLLAQSGMRPSAGDIRCVVFGHLARAAMASLLAGWTWRRSTEVKLSAVRDWVARLGPPEDLIRRCQAVAGGAPGEGGLPISVDPSSDGTVAE